MGEDFNGGKSFHCRSFEFFLPRALNILNFTGKIGGLAMAAFKPHKFNVAEICNEF